MANEVIYPSQPLTGNQNLNYVNNPLDDKTVQEKQAEYSKEATRLYTEKDKDYLGFLQTRLEKARRMRDQIHPEFKNKTYAQYYDENEKIANTFLPPKKNDDDVVISAGTIEQKLDSLLSHVNNLNLSPEVFSFDKTNRRIFELGIALEDIIHDTEIRDGGDGAGDEERKPLRQRELMKQGTVFVQEEWLTRWETKKKLRKEFDGKFKQDADFYTETLTKVFDGPSRTLLYAPNVYLGDITEFYMENQPFIFVVIVQDYKIAETKFVKFDNWKYVQPGKVPSTNSNEAFTIYDNRWRLSEVKDQQVEIILYQDQTRDEFQILINGVCMLPMGFPLSAVASRGRYNIAKQVFRVIHEKFAYGGSFVASGSVKELSAIIDEALKLFVLKTRKSFTPAYVNTSGRVIDKKVLSPGRISMGIDPNALQPIASNETQGVTTGELGMFRELQELVTRSTVSEQFTGQQGKSGTTATEVLELQRQAKMTLGLAIMACSLLEKKLAYLRLYNILEHWFEPLDSHVEMIKNVRTMVTDYRSTNRQVPIADEGTGQRMLALTDNTLPSPNDIRQEEYAIEAQLGSPVRKIYLSPEGLKNAELYWYIIVNAKEKESSEGSKAEFRQEITDILAMLQFGSMPNKAALEEEFSRVYGRSKIKFFTAAQPMPMGMTPDMAGVAGAGGVPNTAGVPKMPPSVAAKPMPEMPIPSNPFAGIK